MALPHIAQGLAVVWRSFVVLLQAGGAIAAFFAGRALASGLLLWLA